MTTTGAPRVDQLRAEPDAAPVPKPAAAQPTAVAQLRSALADLADPADLTDLTDLTDPAEAPGRSAATRTRDVRRPECRVNRAALHDYLHGRLAPSRRHRVELHLDGCAGCTRAFIDVREVSWALRGLGRRLVADGHRGGRHRAPRAGADPDGTGDRAEPAHRRTRRHDLEVGHHAHVLVFGVVAVEEVPAAVAVEPGDDLDRLAGS